VLSSAQLKPYIRRITTEHLKGIPFSISLSPINYPNWHIFHRSFPMKHIIAALLIATCFFTKQSSAQTPPIVKDWFLSTGNWQNDPQLYVCEYGTGKDTVLMLHGGWGADYSGWLTAVANLGNQFHFIFYDQRGSLRSPFPDSLISFDQHIEDIERLRKELGIQKLNLVGHSMGAVLASAYATKYPAHIRRLIMLAPAFLKSPLPADERTLADSAYQKFDSFRNRPAVREELDKYNLNRPSPPLSSREETMKFRINTFKIMVYDVSKCNDMAGGRALYKGHVAELTEKTYPKDGWNYIREFGKQLYPVTIISGDHDFLDFGNALATKWSKEVQSIKLEIINHAGHMIWLDQPAEFENRLASSLKK